MSVRPVKQSQSPDFRTLVLAVVARIPKGRLASYGQVAALAGFPGIEVDDLGNLDLEARRWAPRS